MEASLRDLDAWCWRYVDDPSGYPGLHFTAKPIACDAVIECLDRIQQDGSGSHRTATLRNLNPDDEAKVSGGHCYESFDRIRISLCTMSDALRQMYFHVEGRTVHLDFVDGHLKRLRQGLLDIKNGTGDYSIGGTEFKRKGKVQLGTLDIQSESLWFWPCFGHLTPSSALIRRR